jgi:cell division protein FtsL
VASISASAAAEARVAPGRKPRAATRPRRRRHVSSGVVWIAVFGALLAGVVAINVAVLQSNIQLDKLAEQRANLRAENAALESQVSAAAAGPRIAGLAARRLGLQEATSDQTTYVEIAR